MIERDLESWLARLQHGRSTYHLRGKTQVEDLERRLSETATWCTRNLDAGQIGSCLRPRRIEPRPLPVNRWDVVEDVVRRRGYELDRRTTGVPDGRLLIYCPDEELRDGAAEVVSGGFFDGYNAPPWGTWVGYFEDAPPGRTYLLAWVPRAIIEAANAGIDVNPERCIGWLAGEDVDLRAILRNIGSSWIH